MKTEIIHMIFSKLTEEQLTEILEEMVKFAKDKFTQSNAYYLRHREIDPQFAEDFEDMMLRTDWEKYLPSE